LEPPATGWRSTSIFPELEEARDALLERFRTQEACAEYIRAYREQHGIECPECGNGLLTWHREWSGWRCPKCKRGIPAHIKTVMTKVSLPIGKWFKGIILTMADPAMRPKELQAMLGLGQHEKAAEMLIAIRPFLKLSGSLEEKLEKCLFGTGEAGGPTGGKCTP
jgi:ribosomal protein L37AE/L43A